MSKRLAIPSSANFSSGPVNKVAKWTLENVDLTLLGRSHRSEEFTKLSQDVVFKTKQLLKIPENYKLILVTGGATAAMEFALWNMIGPKDVDCLAWEVFGNLWYKDLSLQLKVKNLNLHQAKLGEYPNLDKVDFKNNDVVFTYSGSTSGVIFKDEDMIPVDRNGLIFADATTYGFSYDINWQKVDVVALSWQKAISGEAAHGIVVVSPKAIERLNNYTPNWPIPSLLNIKSKGQNSDISSFLDTGFCLNTPSTLCFLDAKYNLDWIIEHGGINYIQQKINDNYNYLKNWVKETEWIDFLAKDSTYRSKVIACLHFKGDFWDSLSLEQKQIAMDYFLNYLAKNKVAYDIAMHQKTNFIGIRIWIGYTILIEDIKLLTKWIEVAYNEIKNHFV
ncbi:aminotransferase class V-fold PLP-dependent enzyme [Rickettsiales bacterium LUAb2]